MPIWLNKFKKNPPVAQDSPLKTSLDIEKKEKRCPQCEVLDVGYGYTNINAYCEKCREKNIREWGKKYPSKITTPLNR